MESANKIRFLPKADLDRQALSAGVRVGTSGTHTSRTIMLTELSAAFASVPARGSRADYASAIIHENCLQKPTAATRRATNQRLGELYTLDLAVPIFRVLRRLWDFEQFARPLLALLVALARDPLLRFTASAVIPLSPGEDLRRDRLKDALYPTVGDRLKETVIEKIMRNAASSWTQSGHLEGRTFKIRRLVKSTPVAVALGLYLAHRVGFRGDDLFTSGWIKVLDCDVSAAKGLGLDAKRIGLIDLRMAGDVVELSVDRLESLYGMAAHGAN